jgi:hypothetical protein
MTFSIQTCLVFLLSFSAYASPAIQYQEDQQRYTFPEQTVATDIFFTEFSQYSGIDVYYYPELIIPDIFRGASLQEDELLRLLDNQFSLIKSFQSQQLASMQILPEGQFQSIKLRRAGSALIELPHSSDNLVPSTLLSEKRIRVLKAKEKREQAVAKLQAVQEEKKVDRKNKQAEKQMRREKRQAERQKKELSQLKHFHETDKEIYERLLPFYQHQFGEPDFLQ